MLKYQKISLFEAPVKSPIIHAVNAQGVWGRGIAAEFKQRYPRAFEEYNWHCKNGAKCGDAKMAMFSPTKHWVGWIVTSENYADKTDPPEVIKINTAIALENLCKQLSQYGTIYSNKFNSGLFNVPWEQTEQVLLIVLKRYPNITWIVCDPELCQN